jgi:hypothetical protein
MRDERLEVSASFEERRYVATAPELRQPVLALSLGGVRRRVEALMLPDEPIVVLNLDRAARRERDERRRRPGRGVRTRSPEDVAAPAGDALPGDRRSRGLAVWRAEADELEPRGVALLDGFAEFYPEMAKRIASHLDDMRAFDKQVDDLNRRRPNGVPALSRSTPALAKDLRIPSPYTTGELWWPPPQPNLALQYLATMPPDPFIISEAAKGTYLKLRDRRVMEDNRRQIAEAEQRQREFEERQRKELESAKERDRQTYRERGWPNG